MNCETSIFLSHDNNLYLNVEIRILNVYCTHIFCFFLLRFSIEKAQKHRILCETIDRYIEIDNAYDKRNGKQQLSKRQTENTQQIDCKIHYKKIIEISY